MKKFLLALLFLVYNSPLWAEKISAYEINVTVEQSGELSIIESIEYDFEGASKHGIFRDIPFTVKVNTVIKDLGLYNFSVQLDDSMVEWQQSAMNSDKAGKIIRLKIGSASTYITGKHIYRIAYRVKKGVLPAAQNEQNDAVRWNIIGSGWQIPIANVKANFFLPPSLSQHNIALSNYTGRYGTKSSSATSNWINEKHLQVKVATLKPYEGATVEMAYPANTLDQNGLENVKASFLDWFLGIWHWGALAGFLLYFRTMYKKHTGFVDERSVAVQYEAPKGLSLLESGLVLDKFADNEDFSAAVLELAQLGYLEIDHKDKKLDPLLKRTHKSTEDLSMDQKYLLDHVLFKGKSSFTMSSGSESKASALQKGFGHINDNLYIWSVSDGYMVENPQRVRKNFLWKSILFLLPVLGLLLYSLYTKLGADAIFILIFPVVFGAAGISMMMSKKNLFSKIYGLIFVGAGMTPLLMFQDKDLNINDLLFGPVGVLIVSAMALAFTYRKMGKYTQKGAYARTHLLGLKEFVKRVKEDEIKRRLEMDPLYLEKMLPYAVLFKETDHWLSFFALLNVSTPYWYHGNINNMKNFSSSV
ncbi:MAG TPA: DUF2207 domain-containing protein, partial [Epsilonproteobacteria bacterium]|nr:DUF2207 domain-containing protein [Campylobacterota bacterium]